MRKKRQYKAWRVLVVTKNQPKKTFPQGRGIKKKKSEAMNEEKKIKKKGREKRRIESRNGTGGQVAAAKDKGQNANSSLLSDAGLPFPLIKLQDCIWQCRVLRLTKRLPGNPRKPLKTPPNT